MSGLASGSMTFSMRWRKNTTNLGQCPHQRLVVLHTTRRVDQDDIELVLFGYTSSAPTSLLSLNRLRLRFAGPPPLTIGYGVFGDTRRILPVPLLKQLDSPLAHVLGQRTQIPHVHPELLDRAAPERIARGDEDAIPVLEEPEADFGQVGRLAHSVHADKRHGVRHHLFRAQCGGPFPLDLEEDIGGCFGGEDAGQTCG